MNKTRFAMGDRRWEPYHGEAKRVLAVIKVRDDLAQLQRLEQAVIVASRATCKGLIHADMLLPELSTALCALDQHMNDTKTP